MAEEWKIDDLFENNCQSKESKESKRENYREIRLNLRSLMDGEGNEV